MKGWNELSRPIRILFLLGIALYGFVFVSSCSDFAKSYHVFQISQTSCVRCLACVPKCNYGAISHTPAADGSDSVVIDSHKCVGCGECIRACKFTAIHQAD